MFWVPRRRNSPLLIVLLVQLHAAVLHAQEAGPAPANLSGWVGFIFVLILIAVMIYAYRHINPTEHRIQRLDAPVINDPTPEPTPAPATPAPDSIPMELPKSVFISYRRQDSQHITGRIYDRLSTQLGKDKVFKDVDSIPLGLDFRDHLRDQISRCSVLVAVIGRNWNETAASGDKRLNDRRDHLRIEIETALERRIPVIPVLVDGAEMPTEEELPPSLGRLAYHHGMSVRPDPDFHNDANRLLRGIESLLK